MHPLTGVKTLPFGKKHWVEWWKKKAACLRLHNKNLSGKVAQFWDNWTIFSARLKIDIPEGNSASAEVTRELNPTSKSIISSNLIWISDGFKPFNQSLRLTQIQGKELG